MENSAYLENRLGELFDVCQRNGFKDEAKSVMQKKEDLKEPLYLMIIGSGNTGKSSLTNALLEQKIAEINVNPLTWRIDIFESTNEKPYALFRYDDDNGKKWEKKTSIEQAQEECKRLDKVAQNNKDKENWRSDLKEVKWFLNSQWPKKGQAFIDTPGFNQLRANTSFSEVSLYGSKGVTLERKDGFEYYVYRANVILLCINAEAIEEREAFERIKEIAKDKKKIIIGVITQIDTIEQGRWDNLIKVANATYGNYVDEFVLSAAGSKDEELKRKTIGKLRETIDRLVGEKGEQLKLYETQGFIEEKEQNLYDKLYASGDVFVQNSILWAKHRNKLLSNTTTANENVEQNVERILQKYRDNALDSIDKAYDSSDGNAEVFSRKVGDLMNTEQVNAEISECIQKYTVDINGYVTDTINSISWQGATLGKENKVQKVEQRKNNYLTQTMTNENQINMNFDSLDEWLGVGLGVGAAAAGVGALLLGPIGLLAGGIGYLVGKIKKRSEYTKHAREAVRSGFDKFEEEIKKNLENIDERIWQSAAKRLDNNFESWNGGDVFTVMYRVRDIDSDLDILEQREHETKFVYCNSQRKLRIGNSVLYGNVLKNGNIKANLPDIIKEQAKYTNTYISLCIDQMCKEYVEELDRNISIISRIPFSYTDPLLKNPALNTMAYFTDDILKCEYLRKWGIDAKFFKYNEMLDIKNDAEQYYKSAIKKANSSSTSVKLQNIVRNWDAKIRNDIQAYVAEMYKELDKAIEIWRKECESIIFQYAYKGIQLFDIKNFFHINSMKYDRAYQLYNANENLIDAEKRQWRWADGSSCVEYIKNEMKRLRKVCETQVCENTEKFKNKWDGVVVGYCNLQIGGEFAHVNMEQYKTKSIENFQSSLKNAISRYGENCNYAKTTVTGSFLESNAYEKIIRTYQRKYYSDKALTDAFIKEPILKTCFYFDIKHHIYEKCNELRAKAHQKIKNRISKNYGSHQRNFGMNGTLVLIWIIFLLLAGVTAAMIYADVIGQGDPKLYLISVGLAVIPIISSVVYNKQKDAYVKCITDSILEIQGGGKINEKY